MNTEQRRQARHLYVDQKLSFEATAKHVNVSTMTVYNFLASQGLNRRIPQHKAKTMEFLDRHRDRVLEKYKTMSAQHMADVGNLSLRGVIAWLKKEGVFVSGTERTAKAIAAKRHPGGYRFDEKAKSVLDSDWSNSHPHDYKSAVISLTAFSFRKYAYLLDPFGVRGGNIHLDHEFSIHAGRCERVNSRWHPRAERVHPELVAHPANLRLLEAARNSGRQYSDPKAYDLPRLLKRIQWWNTVHGDPFKDLR